MIEPVAGLHLYPLLSIAAAGPREHVNVLPGEAAYGAGALTVSTVLGSCVAIVLWDRAVRAGGLCHYVLPGAPALAQPGAAPGRWAEGALECLQIACRTLGLVPGRCRAGLFGGASIAAAASLPARFQVGERNAEAGRAILGRLGIVPEREDLGGPWSRRVTLDLADGSMDCRRLRVESAAGAAT